MEADPIETGWIEEPGRPRLFYRFRRAEQAAGEVGAVVVVHGFGEHGGRYLHVLEALARGGWSALALDRRGFGRSEGRRAFVRRFGEYLDDVEAALGEARRRVGEGARLVLMGHSQGGLVAGLCALERRPPIDGLVLVSPALRFAVPLPAWKRALGRLAGRWLPRLAVPAGIDRRWLTHDAEVVRRFDEDPLGLERATARWYVESLAAQERLMESAAQLSVPTLLLVAGDDRIVDARATRRFFERLGARDKRLVWYEGLLHEVLNELERERVLGDLRSWLDRRPPER